MKKNSLQRKVGQPALLGAWLMLACGTAGCGLETYEQRLDQTKKYFAYLDRIDQHLSPPWRSPPIDGLRVPKQFQEIPGPQLAADPQGNSESPEADPRQPDFLQGRIEGLVGAWQAPVDVIINDQREARTAYLYAAVNTPLFQASRTTDALAFSKDLLVTLAHAIQVSPPEDQSLLKLSFPKEKPGYVPRLDYDAALFHPELVIHDALYDVEYYAVKNGDNQVALLVFLPRGMDPQSRISERVALMLESLRISAMRPQASSGGSPAAPGTAAPSAF